MSYNLNSCPRCDSECTIGYFLLPDESDVDSLAYVFYAVCAFCLCKGPFYHVSIPGTKKGIIDYFKTTDNYAKLIEDWNNPINPKVVTKLLADMNMD